MIPDAEEASQGTVLIMVIKIQVKYLGDVYLNIKCIKNYVNSNILVRDGNRIVLEKQSV